MDIGNRAALLMRCPLPTGGIDLRGSRDGLRRGGPGSKRDCAGLGGVSGRLSLNPSHRASPLLPPAAFGRSRPAAMDLYLPIAGLSVNALVIIALGGLVGLLTGMVGVGGGFLTTPILI